MGVWGGVQNCAVLTIFNNFRKKLDPPFFWKLFHPRPILGTRSSTRGLHDLRKCVFHDGTDRQTDRQTDRRTWRLYDQLGPVGPSCWKSCRFPITRQCGKHLYSSNFEFLNGKKTSAKIPAVVFWQKLHWKVTGYMASLFSPTQPHWAELVIESPCPCVCGSVCLSAPSSAVFFEASHWPSGHMTRSRPLIGQPPNLGGGGG